MNENSNDSNWSELVDQRLYNHLSGEWHQQRSSYPESQDRLQPVNTWCDGQVNQWTCWAILRSFKSLKMLKRKDAPKKCWLTMKQHSIEVVIFFCGSARNQRELQRARTVSARAASARTLYKRIIRVRIIRARTVSAWTVIVGTVSSEQ